MANAKNDSEFVVSMEVERNNYSSVLSVSLVIFSVSTSVVKTLNFCVIIVYNGFFQLGF